MLDEILSFDEHLTLYQDFAKKNPEKSIILTIDDLGQAEYTSGHAIEKYDLDNVESYDLTGIDPSTFENGKHIGYLTTPSEFFIRKANFLKHTGSATMSDVYDRELAIDESEISLMCSINISPLDYIDDKLELKIIPVKQSYEAICGFPNGYFSADLSPFENYALAKYLYEKYNYTLFGIGASLLGFIRSSPLEEIDISRLISDLEKIYHTNEGALSPMKEAMKNRNYLLIKYTDCLN